MKFNAIAVAVSGSDALGLTVIGQAKPPNVPSGAHLRLHRTQLIFQLHGETLPVKAR
jgi:hypothetical protein